MEMIQQAIADLVCYGLECGLIRSEDSLYTANRLLEVLHLDTLDEEAERQMIEFIGRGEDPLGGIGSRLEDILQRICDYAYEQGLIEGNTDSYRDLFDTKVMGLMTPRPSEVTYRFRELGKQSPKAATDFFYKLAQDSDYIRRYRIARDMKWVCETPYGDLDITINLSKPEKDPQAIAAARSAAQTAYPKCQLCRENVGYAGRLGAHPARQNHRIIPISLHGDSWFFQYSPYVYYNEHCIVFNAIHRPMKIDRGTFDRLLDFVTQFPHYFIGSNADLPIVGGSILSHDHFQGGCYEFTMARARAEVPLTFDEYEGVQAGIVAWPMSVIRLTSQNREQVAELADRILRAWRGYTDEAAFVFAKTDGEPHNTITPIARRRGDAYELDLVLRNNITTEEYPLGVYHPHDELHHIKKENIGLIEVMGLAVLPARLKEEMRLLSQAIREGKLKTDGGAAHTDDTAAADGATKMTDGAAIEEAAAGGYDPRIESHIPWAQDILSRYPDLADKSEQEVDEVLRHEIGLVFMQVLEHAGVYKRTDEGRAAFLRFIAAAGGQEEK